MDTFLSEDLLRRVVDLLVRVVEAGGAGVIFLGVVIGFVRFAITVVQTREAKRFVPIRLDVGRFLALGLEFQLAGDILRTAITPSFKQIGQLAAIATIRTALNFFLAREIRHEREELANGGTAAPGRDAQGDGSRTVSESA